MTKKSVKQNRKDRNRSLELSVQKAERVQKPQQIQASVQLQPQELRPQYPPQGLQPQELRPQYPPQVLQSQQAQQLQVPQLQPQQNDQGGSLSLIDISYRGVPKKTRERLRRAQMLRAKRRIRRERIRRKVVKGSAVSVLGLSISLAGLFPSSADLLNRQTIRQLQNTYPVEMVLDEELPGSDEDNRRKEQTTGNSGKSLWARLKESARELVLQIPVWIRASVFLPLWAVGYLGIHLLSGLYQVALAPILSHIIGYILCAAIMLGVFVLTMKSIFPNLPLKKILRWKNIRRILIGAAVLKILDIVLPMFFGEYTRYKYLIMLLAGFLILGVILFARRRKGVRKKSTES